jgi:hypothetical protein
MLKAGTNVLGEPSGMLLHGDTARGLGFDPAWSYTIDMAMWLQMLEAGPLIATEDVTASFRVSLSSWSADLTKTQTAEVTRFAEQVLAPAVGRELRRGDLLRIRLATIARRIVYIGLRLRQSR